MLRFGAKVPGLGMDVRSVTMDFTYGSAFSVDSPDAYETLILDALQGDASLFTRADEVEEAWSIVDPIIDAWATGAPPDVPELRRRHLGPGRGATTCSPATAGAGAGSEPAVAVTMPVAPAAPIALNEPVLRWSARAHSIAEIETELARIWARQDLTTKIDGEPARHIAARTSVMNLVVVARRPELAERCAATIQALTGRHPSRTIVVQSADPDGPSWLDARVEAHCILPREDAPETCAETIHLTAGGEAGRHLSAIVTPLIIHDLPVTVWWPGEPPFGSRSALDLLAAADRLVVDGSTWNGDGLERLREMAGLLGRHDASPSATSRSSASRAGGRRSPRSSTTPTSCRTCARCAGSRSPTRRTTRPARPARPTSSSRSTTWPGSHRGSDLTVVKPLASWRTVPASQRARSRPACRGARSTVGRGWPRPCPTAAPRSRSSSARSCRSMPAGTTLRVELLAERRGSELRADVTAEAETVHVRVWQDGVEASIGASWRRAAATSTCWPRPSRPAGATPSPSAPYGPRPSSPAASSSRASRRRQAHERTRDRRPAPTRPPRSARPPIGSPPRCARPSRRAVGRTGRRRAARRPSGIYRSLAARRRTWLTTPWAGRARVVGRRPLRAADHPLSNAKPFDDIILDVAGHEEGAAVGSTAGVHDPGREPPPVPDDRGHRRRRGTRRPAPPTR